MKHIGGRIPDELAERVELAAEHRNLHRPAEDVGKTTVLREALDDHLREQDELEKLVERARQKAEA